MKDLPNAEDILNEMPGSCILFDDDGIIHFVNQTMCDLLGYPESALLNENIESIFTIASRIFYQTQLYPLVRLKGNVNEIFLSLKSRSGDNIPVMVNVKRILIKDRTLNLCLFVSVYEGQKHEQELLRVKEMQRQAAEENEVLNKLKDELELHQQLLDRQVSDLTQRNQEYMQLSKVLSHDLQEPIRKIGMFSDILINGKRQIEGLETDRDLSENPELLFTPE